MTHEENNIGGRAEHPGSDEQKISSMLSGLKRVEAPKDFDFHLKARIANGRPADYRSGSLFPILKYAVPLALFLVVGAGIFAISSSSGWQSPNVVQAPVSEPEPVGTVLNESNNSPVPMPSEQEPLNNSEPSHDPKDLLAENPRPVTKDKDNVTPAPVRPTPKSGGGSLDITGGNSNQDTRCAPGFRCNGIDAREALDRLGIDAVLQGETWKVKSIKANGIADLLGVKPGDKLKALDDKPITRKAEFDNQLKVNTITVIRGDETISLSGTKPPQ